MNGTVRTLAIVVEVSESTSAQHPHTLLFNVGKDEGEGNNIFIQEVRVGCNFRSQQLFGKHVTIAYSDPGSRLGEGRWNDCFVKEAEACHTPIYAKKYSKAMSKNPPKKTRSSLLKSPKPGRKRKLLPVGPRPPREKRRRKAT